MLGDSPSRKMDKVELRSCEKIERSGTDSPFRAGQLRIFKRLRGAKKVSGPGFSIFSQLLSSTLSIPETANAPNTWPIRGFVDSFICRVWGHMQKPLTRL